MHIRKTLITTAIALALASTTSVMAEKAPFNDQLPIDSMPLIEAAPDGLFVGAPMINNLTVMIVSVYNSEGERVLNVRSKGEPVELLAANLPEGEYNYQIESISKLDMPVGQGADFEDEAVTRSTGSFIINGGSLFDERLRDEGQLPAMHEDASVLDQIIDQAGFLAASALDLIIPAAHAVNLTASSTSPTLSYDDTLNGGVEWDVNAVGGFDDYRIRDRVGTNITTVIDLNGTAGSTLNANALVVDADGDVHLGGSALFLDKGLGTLSLGWDDTSSDISTSSSTPEIRFHDTTDTSEAEWQLSNGNVTFWGRPTDVAGWNNILNYDVNAPTDSLSISSTGDINFQNNIHFDTDTTPALNIGGTITLSHTLQLEGNSPELMITGPAQGVEIEGYGTQGLIVNMDTDGDGFSNTSDVFGIANAAPTNSLRIDATGKMGLGLSSPTEALDMLKTDAAARLKMTSVTSTGNEAPQVVWRRARSAAGVPAAIGLSDNIGIFSFRGHDGAAYTGSRALINVVASQNWSPGANGTDMIFQTAANNTAFSREVMRITEDGKVKINGVALNVPDYVFEEDYELMTLDQLAAYIDENKHLPGVASANEVNTTGLDLAGSQLSVLEKVEELTLYTLQQHEELKQVTALKAENAQLKAAHRELLTAFHSQQEKLDKVDQLEQMVNQLMQSQEGKSVYTSLK